MRSGTPRLDVDDDGLELPPVALPDVCDVHINGRHVWSVNVERDTSGGRAAWPAALRRKLQGRAHVELTPTGSTSVLAEAHVVLGRRDDVEVEVVDGQGHPLVVDKWGALVRPLADEGEHVLVELLDQVEALLAALEDAGVPGFICFGTLLGAVRNGRFIGHDNDVDLAFLSAFEHPVDINREGMRVERALRHAGWTVRRGSGVRLNVVLTLSDGSVRFVDVFTACWVEGVLYIPSDFGTPVSRETMLPLSTVQLEGRTLPAPARPAELMALTYGPGWATPDPSFRFESPPDLHRHFEGWFGGLVTHRKHWDAFAPRAGRTVPRDPTPFARWVLDRLAAGTTVVDLGAGTGRDSLWFARHGHDVVAVDYAPTALRRGLDYADRDTGTPPGAVDRIRPEVLNLYDLRAVLSLGARLARQEGPVDLYGRFLMHSLAPAGQDHVLRLASMALRRGGRLHLEFRTSEDRGRRKTFKHRARHFVDVPGLLTAIERHGGRVEHHETGTGLAPFEQEDPVVGRVVATWS